MCIYPSRSAGTCSVGPKTVVQVAAQRNPLSSRRPCRDWLVAKKPRRNVQRGRIPSFHPREYAPEVPREIADLVRRTVSRRARRASGAASGRRCLANSAEVNGEPTAGSAGRKIRDSSCDQRLGRCRISPQIGPVDRCSSPRTTRVTALALLACAPPAADHRGPHRVRLVCRRTPRSAPLRSSARRYVIPSVRQIERLG